MLKLHILSTIFLSLLLNYKSTSSLLFSNDAKDNESLISNSAVPSIKEALNFIYLSTLVQFYGPCEEIESKDIFPDNAQCNYYTESEATQKAMIVTSSKKKLIAVVFAGSDSIEDVMFNFEWQQVPFGPHGDPIIDDVKVHQGGNDALFYYGLFFDLLDRVKELNEKNPDWRIYTSGHSLGGGLSLLMAAGISQYIPDASITNIGYGTPVLGDQAWRNYMNNNTKISIWRYVHDNDIVPRIRISDSWFHVGNTFQLNKNDVNIFYEHYGDKSLGYAGVPPIWDLRGLNNPAKGFLDHAKTSYIDYFSDKSLINPEKYYGDDFVKCTELTCPEDYDEATFLTPGNYSIF